MAALGKKTQIKTLQNAMLLVFFVIALIIFAVFFYSSTTHRMQADIEQMQYKQGILTVAGIAKMGEYSCVHSDYCIDYYKAKAFVELHERSADYADYMFSRLGFAEVYLYQQEGFFYELKLELYDRKPEAGIFSRTLRFNIPCIIYNASSRRGSFGYFNITIYQR
jgi:hypothetical protein